MISLVVAWILVAAAIIFFRWRDGGGMGLVVAFVVSLTSLHWLAAVLYVMPWYSDGVDHDVVATGLQISWLGLVGFGVGVVVASRFLRADPEPVGEHSPAVRSNAGLWYLSVGIGFYVLLFMGLRRVASIGGLAAAGSSSAVFGLCLMIWYAPRSRQLIWIGVAGLLPLITILTQGYLSYGIAALVMVVAFVAEWHRPRWTLVAVGLVLGYVAMSFYVTYMRDRREIREAVWNGATAQERLALVGNTLTSIELFDPFDAAHLARVDDRLNQDYLVGRAVSWIGDGFVPLGQGSTMVDAVLAMVPRAIWPDKNIVAGSGDLVSNYTGMTFGEDTSVGIGGVMEFYVNFGAPGVFVGFAFLGAIVLLFDQRAGTHLRRGHVARACLWYLPGIALLQVGGSLVDITATMAAGFAGALLANATVGALGRVLPAPLDAPDVGTPDANHEAIL